MSSDDDPPESNAFSQITAVVLAAGHGARLGFDLPKPAVPICGRAMASHVLHAVAAAGVARAVVVVAPGERGTPVRQAVTGDRADLELSFTVQQTPRGTADAVIAARDQVDSTHVLVVNGDLPLITAEQIRLVLASGEADAVIATARVDDPARMGRITRATDNSLRAIVEWNDATAQERLIQEINLGCYRFRADFLWLELERLVAETGQQAESYVTDALPAAVARGGAIATEVPTPDRRLNVETPGDVAQAESVIRNRIADRLLDDRIRLVDRDAVWIDARASIEPGVLIEPGVHIRGASAIGAGSRIGPNAVIEDATLGERCVVESCTIRGSVLRDDVDVGPYSTIRPGCEIGSRVHIGTHAELKQARIGPQAQIGHFSYLGDVEVGARANIGAGAITCNFDGESKHRTIIGADVFIGCDTMLVAPVAIGDRARTGAGTVVAKDIPGDGNAVGHPARLTPARQTRDTSEPDR